ncbi:acetyltransferase [Pseudomonas putida]|nr:acetyltransferase [Pseudomonas putida]
MSRKLSLVMLGAGGHAKVSLSLARAAGWDVIGVCDPFLAEQGVQSWRGVPVLGGDSALANMNSAHVGLINGIGQLVQGSIRQEIFEKLSGLGFLFPALVHPTAWVDPSVSLADGVQIMAGVVIQADVVIGKNCIVNTQAGIDHDCTIGAHTHIAPGAILCGGVEVESNVFIACGAKVIQGLRIGQGAIIGAGATLVRDLLANQVLLGPKPQSKIASSDK